MEVKTEQYNEIKLNMNGDFYLYYKILEVTDWKYMYRYIKSNLSIFFTDISKRSEP